MKKFILIGFISFIMIGCIKEPKVIEEKEVKIFWGKKEEIKLFLDSPNAKSERWLIEALGGSN